MSDIIDFIDGVSVKVCKDTTFFAFMQNKYVFYTKKAQNLRFGLLFLFRYFDISISRYIDLPIKLQRSRH